MVDDMFAPKIKDEFNFNRNRDIIIEDPMEKLIKKCKHALDEYKNIENSNLKIRIVEGSREVGVLL